MKVLITGSNGLVGGFLAEELAIRGNTVIGVDIAQVPKNSKVINAYHSCNLVDRNAIFSILQKEKPNAIIHLAAVSSVSQSWQDPAMSFVNNTNIFLNVVESVRELGLKCRILSVGSSEEYGDHPAKDMPLQEDTELRPCNPYAVARVSQELLSRLYSKGYGLDVVMTRSFNQFGPGQRSDFVLPSFLTQLHTGKKHGLQEVRIMTGDLTIVRDFLDVRDACTAYCMLLKKGKSGEVYNVCSGKGKTLAEMLQLAAETVGVKCIAIADPTRIRPTDNRTIIGDNSKLISETGWKLTYSHKDTFKDMLAHLCE